MLFSCCAVENEVLWEGRAGNISRFNLDMRACTEHPQSREDWRFPHPLHECTAAAVLHHLAPTNRVTQPLRMIVCRHSKETKRESALLTSGTSYCGFQGAAVADFDPASPTVANLESRALRSSADDGVCLAVESDFNRLLKSSSAPSGQCPDKASRRS